MLEKTFSPQDIESRHYKRWEDSGAFQADPQSDARPFTIMMPPPNLTGTLHIGHALNMTLQDVLTRYYRMNGRDALWLPGTDHASIAVHSIIEKQLQKEGTNRFKTGREKFLEKTWEFVNNSGTTITGQLRKLGVTPDWSREAFTMSDQLSRAVTYVFCQLHKEGLIYRDKRLVNWDPRLETSVADLEVDQREVKGHMWHIAYSIEGDEASTITVATTRPETLLGDTAIAVHPEDGRYRDLIGKFAVVPVANRPIPIIADEYADPEQGSGAVKITPAHDFNDFEVGRRHDLAMINIFDKNARLNSNAPEDYQGLERFEARKKLLSELEELDQLVQVDDITHTVPYGERSGEIIEPYLTDQWFCDAPTLAKPAIQAVESGEARFIPKNWENTYFDWMRNIQPWCISRQLWWGHRIPAWYGPDDQIFVAESEEEALHKARDYYGEDVALNQDPDVLDTWFSSALWPFSTLGWPDETPELKKYYPGDTLITGFDIIFFWVARMMMMGIHFMGEVPFRDIYMHALVRDAKGQKMSKSKGNVIDPITLIDTYGADALRFTLIAMAAQGRDIKLSEDRVEGYRNFATKLWNATRFCEMNDSLPRESFNPDNAHSTLNRWIVSSVMDTKMAIDEAVEAYKFNEAASAIYHFVWHTFCDWYLEFTKPVLTDESQSDEVKEEVRATTGWVLDQILLLLNPFMPFITEELYQHIAKREKEDMLVKAQWPDYQDVSHDYASVVEISWLIRVITEIRSIRSDMNVPASVHIDLRVKGAEDETRERFERHTDILKRIARLNSIEMTDEAETGAVQTVVDEATLIMPIAEIIDLDKERERLRREVEKLSSELKKIDQKLDNEQFLDNAPEEVVTEQRMRREETESKLRKLNNALKQLEVA